MNKNILVRFSSYTVLLVFSIAVALCFMCVSELDAREQVKRTVERDLSNSHADLGRILDSRDVIGDERLRSELLSKIASISVAQNKLTALENFIAVGSWDGKVNLRVIAAGNSHTFFFGNGEENEEKITISVVSKINTTIGSTSNDSIMALLIILCSFVGSCVASIRGLSEINVRTLLLGIGSGLLIYLFAKGGLISIFQSNSSTQSYPLNPYSISFLSVIAGLYSEKLFHLLGVVSDKWATTIEGESTNKQSQ